MRKSPRIAFYAPLKSPNDPAPSGDREIARLLMKALSLAEYEVELASEVKSYQKRAGTDLFAARKAATEADAKRLIEKYEAEGAPDAWFTYHPYCKAPDWIGPGVARHFHIPYFTAELARTRQGKDADWQQACESVQDAARLAAVNFCLKPSDRDYLREILPQMDSVVRLAPFLDVAALPPVRFGTIKQGTPLIVTIGMMRPGKKHQCYQWLALALRQLADIDWRLVAIGDGPMRDEIEAEFAPVSNRLAFVGGLSHNAVIDWLDKADLFAWPGIREPIGMVYLEAQARGVPVAALNSLGVPIVVRDGVSGLLADEDSLESYTGVLRQLITDGDLRTRMGQAGRENIVQNHSMDAAARVLKRAIDAVLA